MPALVHTSRRHPCLELWLKLMLIGPPQGLTRTGWSGASVSAYNPSAHSSCQPRRLHAFWQRLVLLWDVPGTFFILWCKTRLSYHHHGTADGSGR
jgi:hypothetical protein